MTDTQSHACKSCTMPIEGGEYCQYCADETGALKPFDDRFESIDEVQLDKDGTESQGLEATAVCCQGD
jgi:hypothetical protein